MSNTFGLVVHPQSEEEIFRSVSDFADALLDAVKAEAGGEGKEGEARGV